MSRIAQMTEDEVRHERANRGKYAEGKVREFLKVVGLSNAKFDWERKYDARAARGRFPSQAGDFGFYMVNRHGLIEVKEVHHAYRLPKKNFSSDVAVKFGKLKARMLAGGEITVLVCHITPEAKFWRCVPFEWFLERAGQPSWDLSEFKTYSKVSEALYLRGISELR